MDERSRNNGPTNSFLAYSFITGRKEGSKRDPKRREPKNSGSYPLEIKEKAGEWIFH